MKYDFRGKKALVTGAGQGIGRAVAVALHNSGANVYALSKTYANLESLRMELGGGEERLTLIDYDLTDTKNLHKTLEPFFPFDLLVNNAGTNVPQSFLDVSMENFDSIFDINFKSAMILCQMMGKSVVAGKKQNGASVVNVSSQASTVMLPDHFAYTMSKSAMDTLTKYAAWELGQYNVRVNAVNPTVVLTDLGRKHWSDPTRADFMLNKIPLKKFAEVDDVVGSILFLLSDDSKMITGTCLPIDGGCSI